jgi:aryl-alcohol dehydrogenase-like predicted oxidoreductase
MEYSLVERNIEHEFTPAAQEMGLGIVPWSPLAFGFLTGKYSRDESGNKNRGRLDAENSIFQKFTERNWNILNALREVGEEAGLPLPQVALSWALARPAITSLIIGASKVEQLQSNIASLEVTLSPGQTTKLDNASAPENLYPYSVFTDPINRSIFAGAKVVAWGQSK